MDTVRYLWLCCGLAVAAGCYTGSAVDINRPPAVEKNATEPSNEGGGASEKTTGLPCNVSKILLASCAGCHGSILIGAKTHLLTYEQLTAPLEDDPTKNVAELSLARMRGAGNLMPPDKALRDADIATFEAWVGAGSPRGSCGEKPVVPTDTDGGSADTVPDAGATSACTSGTFFDSMSAKNSRMDPGTRCLSCHKTKNATPLFAAGTVYPTLHEPDQCIGASGSDLTVVLIDANGVSYTVSVNSSGNFVRYTSIPTPYRAMVVRGNEIREMKTPVTDGDCNGCHSEWANGDSPGRVMAP